MQGARAPQPGATNRPSPSGPFRPPPPPTVLKGHLPQALCGPQGARSADPPLRCPRRNAPRGPAALAAGAHPDPCRTRKLSRPAPKVLQGRPCGRLGRRRPPGRVARAEGGDARKRHLGGGDPRGSPLSVAGASRVFAKKKGRRPPRGRAAFCVRGLLRGLRGSVGGLLHVADPRRAFLAGRGSEGGLRFDALGVRCLSPLLPVWPRARYQLARLCWRASRPAIRYRREVVSHVPEDAEHVSRHRAACNRSEFPAFCR